MNPDPVTKENGTGLPRPVETHVTLPVARVSAAKPVASGTILPVHLFTNPIVISEAALNTRAFSRIKNYVVDLIRNPDKGSAFEKVARLVSWLPDRALIKLLKLCKYDGLIYSHPGEVVAHVMFQKHGKDLHVFSVYVASQHRGNNFAEKAIIGFFDYAKKRPDIERVRIGGGRHPIIEKICNELEKRSEELGIVPAAGRWYSFKK